MGKLTEYRYSGPLSSASIVVNGVHQDVLLNPWRTVSLPADHEFTRTLMAQRLLTEIPVAVPATPISTPGTKKTKESQNGS